MPNSVPDPAGEAFARELKVAVAAAEEAGGMLRGRFPDVFQVRTKGENGDVVTDLDLAAEKIVLTRLQHHFPYDRVLSEEAGLLGADGSRTWLVDPLDGSNNIAIGLASFVVGIGLCVGDTPVVGVVHEPVTGHTWHAVAGQGAYGPRGRLTGPGGGVPESGPVLAWTQGHAVDRADTRLVTLRGALERRCRRVLQLWAPLLGWSMLARGTIDGFVGYRAEGVDLPAGALLAAEAGVELRTLTGEPFRPGFTGPDEGRSFVAAKGAALEYVLREVAETLPRTP
ncbi:inositol monophosphatase family protein [Streptomyces spiramyceticus]|uniref:inositol monophosphatase family protein n=1 Tax=Streptomyces spiramyceticus TaxID=299717 RepID=UPI00237C39B7|nr:inositol monophosphatase family protein [Streptomyces spiramyceticus]